MTHLSTKISIGVAGILQWELPCNFGEFGRENPGPQPRIDHLTVA